MPYTRVGSRFDQTESKSILHVPTESVLEDKQARAEESNKLGSRLHHGLSISRHPQTLATTEKPTKTTETTTPKLEELLKRAASELPKPTTINNNLIPHWSYEKSSFAAACVFSGIAALALIFLAYLAIRKISRSWKRHKRELRDFTAYKHRIHLSNDGRDSNICIMTESKSSRDSLMYSRDTPSLGYVVEQTGGSVTRVYREGNNVSTRTFDSIGASSEKTILARKSPKAPERRSDARTPSGKGRAGSIPRPIVVVPSPLKHVSSLRATPVLPLTASEELDSEQSPISRVSRNDTEVGSSYVASGSKSLFRLPSIKRTVSPLFGS
ncbi:hypothetical protein BDV29DRAFT_153809 [Aspergillus leporis]|uniref:Uncharacterized protein n=1 Tax=Aspergillus leporis TaxID=41062 RepID=A0A5N5XBB8_9EURO|nr:hypothetical protein BDV29DRAFT_153809 [Aspergillus leporis]